MLFFRGTVMKYAVMIDGDFLLKRYRFFRKDDPRYDGNDAKAVADDLHRCVLKHSRYPGDQEEYTLYRIFYYDCYPLVKRTHNPVSKKAIDFSKTEVARFRLQLFDELKRKRKVALRLGEVKEKDEWMIRPRVVKELLKGIKTLAELHEDDVFYHIKQKRVDMMLGIDIASLAYKKNVDRIILISGDGDFVPAAKVARREGIDFILDSMGSHIDPHLHEHIDGLRTVFIRNTATGDLCIGDEPQS